MSAETNRQRLGLALILGVYLVVAVIYSIVTPLFEASDELWHYPMVKYVADHDFGLPIQDPANPGPWRQEGGQPPLYYLLGAALTRWIDTSDIDLVRRVNPHADLGVIVPDGNVNMVVHNPAREDFPWSGTVLAMHLVRFLSILMGMGTVWLTYCLGRELFPDIPAIALAAAAFTAFNPMFIFVSAVINNDNLSTLLASALLFMIVRLVKQWDTPPPHRTYAALGIVAGLGMLSKFQFGFMLPIIALVLLILSIRARDWRPFVLGGAIAGGITIAIAGWWYWRNYDLYGDATGINVFLDLVGRRAVPADLAQLWTERKTFMMSYWGFFGGINVPMRDSTYTLFNLLAILAMLGWLVALVRELATRFRTRTCPAARSLLVARALTVAWAVIVLVSLLIWTRQTWASQGRLWFSAIAALNVWMAAGIAAWAAKSPRIIATNLAVAAAAFAMIAALQPFTTIRPAYTLDHDARWATDTLERGAHQATCFAEPGSGAEALCIAYQTVDGSLQPGDYLYLSPSMTVKQAMQRDWSIFVHLVNEDGGIEAQRDIYPGGGLLATSDLQPGESWNNRIAVHIPQGIYTPQELDVYLGLYDLNTFDRMIPAGANADPGANRLLLGRVELATPPGTTPNPVNVNFDDRFLLRGYEVSNRSLRPGESTDITLYWEALQSSTTEYVISVQIIDPDPSRLVKAAQIDSPPTPPTTTWQPGETIRDTRSLTVMSDTPPGRYRVLVRVYPANDPAHPLRIRAGAGGQSQDFVWLSWIQVKAP